MMISTLFLSYDLTRSVLVLIVTMEISALCVVFYCYELMISALFVVFDCYDNV